MEKKIDKKCKCDNLNEKKYKCEHSNEKKCKCDNLNEKKCKCDNLNEKKCKCKKCKCSQKDKKCFSRDNVTLVRFIYAFAIVFWIWFLCYLNIWNHMCLDVMAVFLLVLPIFILSFNAYHISKTKVKDEKYLMKGNVLYIAFIAIGIFINWKRFEMKTPLLFYKIIYASLIMLALSVLDFYYEDFMVCICLKTIFQTLAVTLLLLALYVYYIQILKH